MQPELLDRDRSALVLIDVQERLFPYVHDGAHMLERIDLLLSAAKIMHIPFIVTEQYPKGLGGTIEPIRKILPDAAPVTKMDFSCASEPGFMEKLSSLGRDQIVLAGIEAHICVAQTAIELARAARSVYVAADAVSSRRPQDVETALRRLERSGVAVTTSEAVVFEWLRRAGTEEFKALQPKIKALS